MARRDEFLKRDTLSLFGDDSRSDCTVAEAKAFEKNLSRRRRRLAVAIVVPVVVIVIGVAFGFWWHEKESLAAIIEQEQNKPLVNEKVTGVENARFEIEVQGMDEESIPMGPFNMVKQAFFTKPSEIRMKEVYGMTEAKTPLPFRVVVNGKEAVDVKNDAGETVTVDFSDYNSDPALYARAICQEWNSVYPDALHPLVLKVADKFHEDEIMPESPQNKFKDIPLINDPRTEK